MQSPIPPVPTTAAVAARLERAARILAPLLCLAIAAALTLAECFYLAGHALGSAVHQRNDELAALWRRVCRVPVPTTTTAPVPTTTTAPVPTTAPVVPPVPPVPPVPVKPALHPLAALADSLDALTVAELRRITGTRRKCRKAELVSLALVMA